MAVRRAAGGSELLALLLGLVIAGPAAAQLTRSVCYITNWAQVSNLRRPVDVTGCQEGPGRARAWPVHLPPGGSWAAFGFT